MMIPDTASFSVYHILKKYAYCQWTAAALCNRTYHLYVMLWHNF